MDAFRQAAGPEANLQTLSRGVNVVGLTSQPRDIIKMHARLFKKHGMTTIRNFDALNDVDNLVYSGQCIHDAGLKHEVCVTMMELPPGCEGSHTPESYAATLRKILDAGIPFDSVCFKDASGTSVPAKVFETVKQARALLGKDAHIVFHSHETAGIGVAQYLAAINAGADQVDLSLAPCSGGTCQTDVLTMWHALRGTDYDLGLDIDKIIEAEKVFKECMADYFLPPEATAVEPLIPFSPMPGGALTANTQMLRDNGIMDKYAAITANMGEVVKLGGCGTSVTPVSQFYFQQAFNNVMAGPGKKIAPGYGKMVLGYFGKTPVAPDPMVVKAAQEQLGLPPTSEKATDIDDRNPKKGVEAARGMLKEAKLPETDENVFIAACCEEKGIAFLKGEATVGVRKNDKKADGGAKAKSSSSSGYTVTVDGKPYAVKLEGGKALVNGQSFDISVEDGIAEAPAPKGGKEHHYIEAPLPGLVLRLVKKPGDKVAEGEAVLVIESMKMETAINAPVAGVVEGIPVVQGQKIAAGDILAKIAH